MSMVWLIFAVAGSINTTLLPVASVTATRSAGGCVVGAGLAAARGPGVARACGVLAGVAVEFAMTATPGVASSAATSFATVAATSAVRGATVSTGGVSGAGSGAARGAQPP